MTQSTRETAPSWLDPTSLPLGERLAGRYRLDAVLGEGATSRVYEALDEDTGATVAVKVLDLSLAHAALLEQRFLREARIGTSLQHPNIARVWELGRVPETDAPYLVMERLEGMTLLESMKRRPRRSFAELLEVIEPVGRALGRDVIDPQRGELEARHALHPHELEAHGDAVCPGELADVAEQIRQIARRARSGRALPHHAPVHRDRRHPGEVGRHLLGDAEPEPHSHDVRVRHVDVLGDLGEVALGELRLAPTGRVAEDEHVLGLCRRDTALALAEAASERVELHVSPAG